MSLIIIMLLLLIISSIYDIRTLHLPVWLVSAIILLGLTAVIKDIMSEGPNPGAQTVRICILILTLIIMTASEKIRTDTVGIADILILCVICILLRGEMLILTLGVSFFLAGSYSGILLMIKKADKKSKIAFIPFLTLGVVISLMICGLKGMIWT
ncbi:MAG: prepilin peptidase [Lachnospiraceae bacterium]|nr:prepilin peptidase [Lachnospiraceae bacterium]